MKINISLILTVCIMILFSSCAKNLVPYNDALAKKYDLDPTKLQYYVSDEIHLKKDSTDLTVEIVKGRIKAAQKKNSDEVIIAPVTPGICVKTENGNLKLILSFEANEANVLSFVKNNELNRFTLAASEWRNKTGKLTYGGATYFTPSGDASLLVDLTKIEKYSKKTRKVRGHKI